MSFQKQLQKLRKEKGLSQEKLAEMIGISRQAVAKWEVGQSYPDLARLILLSELFKVSIDKLVNDYDENCRLCIADNKQDYNNEDIIQVLCRAKKSIHKDKSIEDKNSVNNAYDMQYSEGDFKYINKYHGREQFLGEELLRKDDNPIWGMNYNGRIIGEGFSEGFLKEALALVTKEHPYRGPMVYQNGQYKYHCIVNGEFQWFQGYEEIFFNDIKIYECVFNGGYIK
ncbi:hypothetical protein AN1V17_04560 [Vallitalea sediminicola]